MTAVHHCRVLPPGKFNGKIPQQLTVYYECVTTKLTLFARRVATIQSYKYGYEVYK